MSAPDWWTKPRSVNVVVDNDSWILPFASRLVGDLCAAGDDATLIRRHEDVRQGAVAFYLGCVKITPAAVLARNNRNLVVHASNLPKGRGFSPSTWLILEGSDRIPVCLIDAADVVDAGSIVYREWIELGGFELNEQVRALLGEWHVRLCQRYMSEVEPPVGQPQRGEPTRYRRRMPEDSRLDPQQSIAAQFNLLRVVDNDRYPAFFDYAGHRYVLRIDRIS